MSNDIFTKSEAQFLYEGIFRWLTFHSVGEHRTIGSYKRDTKDLFMPLINKYNCISKRENLTKQEKQFIEDIFYIGRVFRIHTYSESSKSMSVLQITLAIGLKVSTVFLRLKIRVHAFFLLVKLPQITLAFTFLIYLFSYAPLTKYNP